VEPDDGENGQRRLCRGGRREGAGRLCRAGPDIFMARFGTKMEANSGDQHSADRPISRLRGGRRRPSASVSRVTIRAPGHDAKKSRRAVRWTGGRRSLIDRYSSLFLYNRSAICYL
jgi:hypothetical protein